MCIELYINTNIIQIKRFKKLEKRKFTADLNLYLILYIVYTTS